VENLPRRLGHKEETKNQKYTGNELHRKRCNPLRGGGLHGLLDAITDPEAKTCSDLHTNLVEANKSTANRRWGHFGDVQRNHSASEANSLELLSANEAKTGCGDLRDHRWRDPETWPTHDRN
jgi:hypothetical protein